MGNTKSSKLKELFMKGHVEIIQSENEKLLGTFKVLRVESFKDEIFILKILDPRIYDQYSDITEFIKKLSQQHSSICDFYFINNNSHNVDLYDILFEYGPVMEPSIQREKEVWAFINQISEALFFLEENMLHYPILAKRYVIQISKDKVKLLNPHCFPDFIKEVLQIYLNPMNPMSNRRKYHTLQISRNIKEFGIMIITLLVQANEYQLKTDIAYVSKTIDMLANKYSKNLTSLLKLILMSQNPPKTIYELCNHISVFQSKSQQLNKTISLTNGDIRESLAKEKTPIEIGSNEIERMTSLKDETSRNPLNTKVMASPVKPKGIRIFSDEKSSETLKHRSVTPTTGRINKLNTTFESQNVSKGEIVAKPLPGDNLRQRDYSQTNDKKNSEIKEEEKKKGFLENFMSFGSKFQKQDTEKISKMLEDNEKGADSNIKTSKDNREIHELLNIPKEDFFRRASDSLAEKRATLIDEPLFQDNHKPEFEFINTPQSTVQNINSYLQTHDKNVQEKLLQNHNSKMENLFEPPIENEKNSQVINNSPEKIQAVPTKQPEDSNPQNQPNPTNENIKIDSQLENVHNKNKNNRIIRRIFLKWNTVENKHVRFVEYDDGTVEEAKEENQESKNQSSVSNPPNPTMGSNKGESKLEEKDGKTGQIPNPEDKPSHMLKYDITKPNPPIPENQFAPRVLNILNFILFPDSDQPPFLLFRSRPAPQNTKFESMSSVVNKNNPIFPSMYHNIEEFKRVPTLPVSKSVNEFERNTMPANMPKPEPVKFPSMANLSEPVKQPAPITSLNRTAQIIKRN
jgi:hypothetical protein